MRPNQIECVLFDCDGVLVDSEPVSACMNAKIYNLLGAPVTFEDCLELCGKDGSHIPEIAAKYGVSVSENEFVAKRQAMRAAGELTPTVYLEDDLELMPGVCEVLKRLRAAGIKCGLVSTTIAPHLLMMLNRFGLTSAFDVIISGDMDGIAHKPNPDSYLAAMSALGITPEHAVVVEDSVSGIAAGVASGAYVLGFQGSIVKQDISEAHEALPSYAEFDLV